MLLVCSKSTAEGEVVGGLRKKVLTRTSAERVQILVFKPLV